MNNEPFIYTTEHAIHADAKQIAPVCASFIEFLISLGIHDTEKEGWKLTFTEAVNNAIKHGSNSDPEKIVTIRWWSTQTSVWVETEDQGKGPDHSKTEAPSLPEDPLSESGRGLFIINNFAENLTHWYSKKGYIIRIGKSYQHLNNVMPQNAEMDAILEELSDCYESLSLYDRMVETLVEDERVDHFIESSLEIFMDSRDYDAISIELRHPDQSTEYAWVSKLSTHAAFGTLQNKYWNNLEQQEALTWQPGNNAELFSKLDDLCVGGCVAIYVNEQVFGLISAAYKDPEKNMRTTNLRNLRALSDIIGTALSRAISEREQDEKKRITTEMTIATKLQHQLLPTNREPLTIDGYGLFTQSLSALEVAGDFVEVCLDSSGDYLGCVIDVMGKGVSAAILAGIFRSQFIAFSEQGGELKTFIERTNRSLRTQLGDTTMFITAFVFKLNASTHEFSYVAAGHPPALLFTADGETKLLTSKEPPIGLFEEIQYNEESLKLKPSDRIVIVTDGLYEWSTFENDIFGWDELVKWCEAHRMDSPDHFWQQLHSLIEDSRSQQGILEEDDETILILTRTTDT
ncbi:MAG: serine phosphatase RsbU (regulator of sigma subunit)/anti-sigma regulatory factor (Ser/Thr protein kinase) [Lentimonas sp.]|jgi:serine phosphatase RsbU (regulator of sigma subunit)/anti-sigma regulatory factor (Ser/Thr protein kinase)